MAIEEVDYEEYMADKVVVHDSQDAIVTSTADGQFQFAARASVNERSPSVEYGRSISAWAAYAIEEYNAELQGHNGLRVYNRMKKSDSATRSSLRVITTPLTGGKWFVDPADDSKESKEIADFVNWNLFDGMTYTWPSVLDEILHMLTYGHYLFEKVWDFTEYEGERRVYLRKLASRHPLDVREWLTDSNGGPDGVVIGIGDESGENEVRINIEKLCIFTYDQEGSDLRGLSLLRSAYKHWYFKENAYKIDAIQKERHGIGIPVINLPPGFTPKDRAEAIDMARNFRTNEKAYAVLPFGWEIVFAKIEGQPVSAMETADHHARMIFMNVLGQAIWNTGGSSTDADESMNLFYKSARQIAGLILDTMNRHVIPQLVSMNWDVKRYPKMRVRGLGDTGEAREISFALRNLVGGEIIKPDDPLEDWTRAVMDAPPRDPSTTRKTSISAKIDAMEKEDEEPSEDDERFQNQGMPKQSKAGGMRKSPSKKEGQDGNGQS